MFILKESLDFDLLDCFFFGFIEVIWEKIGFFEKMKEVNVVIRWFFGGKEIVEDFIYGLDVIVVVDEDGNVCFMIYIINS